MQEMDAHDRRRERDRADQAARRAEARASGERVGHGLDALIIDAVALFLAGCEDGDPIKLKWTKALTRAVKVRKVPANKRLVDRLQARLTIGSSLENALIEAKIEAIERERDGRA